MILLTRASNQQNQRHQWPGWTNWNSTQLGASTAAVTHWQPQFYQNYSICYTQT
jgi:hypothetical protein